MLTDAESSTSAIISFIIVLSVKHDALWSSSLPPTFSDCASLNEPCVVCVVDDEIGIGVGCDSEVSKFSIFDRFIDGGEVRKKVPRPRFEPKRPPSSRAYTHTQSG